MKENYQRAYKLIRESEGGFVHRSKEADPGGATNYGITQATYDNYRKSKGLPLQPVKLITEEEVDYIYREDYAKPVRFNELPLGVDYFLFDTSIHSGPVRAVKLLQRTLGVKEDGRIGNQTLGALRAYEGANLIPKLKDTRMQFLRGRKNWKHNANGWTNRVNKVTKQALAMAQDTPIPVGGIYEGEKAIGPQSLMGSIESSTRSKSALAGSAGIIIAAAGEAGEVVSSTSNLFSFSKYASLIGLIVALLAFGYIIYRRSKKND